jgi:hypothetical protein
VEKYRPIRLINIGGKILEKLLIDRINHDLYSKRLVNENQFGFCPQRSTLDASMAGKRFCANISTTKEHSDNDQPRRTGGIRRSMVACDTEQLKKRRVPQEFTQFDELFQ